MPRQAPTLEPIHPGDILRREFMQPHAISINALARELSVPPGRISQIVRGRRAITADTALRLAKFFGLSPRFWLNLQSEYDLRLTRRTTWPDVEPSIRPLAG